MPTHLPCPRRQMRVWRSGYQSPWRIQRPQNQERAGKIEGSSAGKARRGLKQTQQFSFQFVGDDFVGIQVEYPFGARLVSGRILLRKIPFPGFSIDLCAVAASDFVGAICCIRVQDDDEFAGPIGHTFKRAPDPVRFRAGDHADRDGQLRHWPRAA